MMSMSSVISTENQKRLSQVRVLLLDVDGILTDARVFLDASGEWRRFFSIRDGYGIMRIKEAGYQVGIITGSKALDVSERAKRLDLDFLYEGSLHKEPALKEILEKTGLSPENIAYMGDDVFDVPLLEKVGFAATVEDAMDEAKAVSTYVARRPAGNGAVREVCDLILKYGAYVKE